MTAEPGAAGPGGAGSGTAGPGTAERGSSEPVTAQRGTAQPDTAQPGTAQPGTAGAGRASAWVAWAGAVRPRWLPVMAGWAAVVVVLFFCYLRVSRTIAIESDGGADALQAWAILHGNVLLRGWHLSALSFYATDLLEYVLIELAHGLGAGVIHIGAAMTYTVLLVLAALLAKGRATGRQAAVRMLIAGGIMIAPELGSSIKTLLESPDHVGTSALVLATWLLLDRAPRRWYVPPAITIALVCGVVSDNTVVVTGVLPLLSVCAVRIYRARIVNGASYRSVGHELTLAAAALLVLPMARAVLALISAASGFSLSPAGLNLVPFNELLPHALDALDGLLLLFGADFTGRNLDLGSVLTMLHLAGLALAAWAVCRGVRHFLSQVDVDLVTALLLAGLLLNLAAYLIGWRQATREMVAVLPMSAVLAGRLLGARLDRARLAPALAVVLAGYLLSLGLAAARPAAPDPSQQLGQWLAAHHLRYGLAGYWQANAVTVASQGHVAVRAVAGSPYIGRGTWEEDKTWYDPATHSADFVILAPGGLTKKPVLATFGPPSQIYHDGVYTVLVWNKNLLSDLNR
jgi:hypothetical protein